MASFFDLNARRDYTDAGRRTYDQVYAPVNVQPSAGGGVYTGPPQRFEGGGVVGPRPGLSSGRNSGMIAAGGGGYPGTGINPGGMLTPGTGGLQRVGGTNQSGMIAAGGGGQDPRAFLQSLAQGGKLTPQQLTAAIPQLQQMGVRVLGANSEGLQSKIQLPNGQIIDLIKDAGGRNTFQWLNAGGGETGGGFGGGGMFGGGMMGAGGLPEGYWMGDRTGGGKYPLASAGGPGLAAPWLTPFESPGDFKPPNVTDDPGFKFRMEEGQKALERSAAARGTLLTGGTLKDLGQYAQGLASQEYGNAYNRALGQNELAYNRAIGEYGLAHDIWSQNQGNLYNRLSNLAGLGQTSAGGLGGYANSMSDLITGAGNARAAGQIGSANAWGNMVGGLGQIGSQIPMWYSILQQNQAGAIPPGMGGYGGYPANI